MGLAVPSKKSTNPGLSEVWRRIERHAGEEFRQIRGRRFTYEVHSGCVIPSTTRRRINRLNFEEALKLVPLQNTVAVQHLQGPSYIYAILMDPRIRGADW
jgi:hypothetical protein